MKVCFLLKDLQIAGGIGVVVNHARQLSARHPDFDVSLILTESGSNASSNYSLDGVHLRQIKDLESDECFDIAIATWWETALDLFEVEADRYGYFVQSLEDRFYEVNLPVNRLGAQVTYSLPVAFITEAQWIADFLRSIRPEAPCYYVRNGIDKGLFKTPSEPTYRDSDEPLRILIEGHPYVWFKGVPDAIEAARGMTEPSHVTLVMPQQYNDWAFDADRVVGPLGQEELVDLYKDTDVVLKLSRVEGMFYPPLEGFHMGTTCVVTPVTGHEEYVEHGWNGIVTDFDDLAGTARWLDLLSRDRRYLHFLKTNALKTAEGWPGWDQASELMAAALKDIHASNPSPAVDGGRQVMRNMRNVRELLTMEKLDAVLLELEAIKRRRAYRVLSAFGRFKHGIVVVARKIVPKSLRRVIGRARRRLAKVFKGRQ